MTDTQRLAAPTTNYTTEVWTYRDAVDRVLDVFSDEPSARQLRQAAAAVLSAARRLPSYHEWKCFTRRAVINVVAAYSTGTVAYTHSSRTLTLTDGTWPSWAAFGEVKIGNVVYQIESRTSDSAIVLEPNSNPGANVASGTSYSLFRSRYPLPVDFRRLDDVYRSDRSGPLSVNTAQGAFGEALCGYGPMGIPRAINVVNDPKYMGGLSVQLTPTPATAETVTFQYHRGMRPLRTLEYNTGTAATVGTALTITAGVLTDLHVGCLIRFSSSGTAPTSVIGNRSDVVNPAVHEATILSRSSATAAVLDAAPSSDVSAVAFTISDPIDLNSPTMFDAFLALAEWEYGRIAKRKDSPDHERNFMRALNLARDADRRTNSIESAATAWQETRGWFAFDFSGLPNA